MRFLAPIIVLCLPLASSGAAAAAAAAAANTTATTITVTTATTTSLSSSSSPSSSSSSTAKPSCDLKCQTDKLLFHTPMEVFLGAKKARSPPALIWTDDGCSTAPDHPLDFNFADSCRRHDFGYRNYAAQGRLNDAARRRLDRNLWRDLLAECARIRRYNFLRRKRCRRTARFYYKAVRVASRRDKLHDKNKHQQHKHELTQQQQQQQQQQHQNQNQSQSQSQNQHKHLKQHQNQTKYHNSTSSSLLSNVNSTRLP